MTAVSDYQAFRVELADKIAHVQINRPDKVNAMNADFWREIVEIFRWVDATDAVRVVVLSGARTPGELLYAEDFRAFADAHPQFRYVPSLSRELPAPGSAMAHADVRHGYVQQQLAEFAPDPATDIAYLCGNPDMVDACFEALKDYGLPIPQIRREK